jgi:hypothetical protein
MSCIKKKKITSCLPLFDCLVFSNGLFFVLAAVFHYLCYFVDWIFVQTWRSMRFQVMKRINYRFAVSFAVTHLWIL